MKSPPVTWAYLQPGKKWISVDNFPVEVFDVFKLGKDAQFYDGLTGREIKSRCLKGMGQVLSDFMRVVDGFGSGGGVEVDNLRTALEQSEKEKSEKEKADLRDKLDLVYKLYETHRVARLRAEEERALLKAELEKLKAREG